MEGKTIKKEPNPQIEDGFVKIATELWEALTKIRIPGQARQVLDAIFRKTYGWHKKEDIISLSQLEKMTNLKRPNIIRAREKLLSMNLIVIKKDNEGNINYRIQKNYLKWKPLSKTIIHKTVIKNDNASLSKTIMGVIKNDNASLSKTIHTKDTTTKDTITKDTTTKDTILLHSQRKQKKSQKTNPNIKIFIDDFFTTFKQRTGAPYLVTGKDAKIVQRLLQTYSLAELQTLKDLYFDSQDPFVLKAGYSIGVFASVINKLISQGKTGQPGIEAFVREMRKKLEKEKN